MTPGRKIPKQIDRQEFVQFHGMMGGVIIGNQVSRSVWGQVLREIWDVVYLETSVLIDGVRPEIRQEIHKN